MPKVSVQIQRKDMDPITIDAFLPFIGCPLGATRPLNPSGEPDASLGWRLTHIPTGMKIGPTHRTKAGVFNLIARLDPHNTDWFEADGSNEATRRCYEIAQKALNEDV